MYVCLYVWMYVCLYVWMYVCMYVCIYRENIWMLKWMICIIVYVCMIMPTSMHVLSETSSLAAEDDLSSLPSIQELKDRRLSMNRYSSMFSMILYVCIILYFYWTLCMYAIRPWVYVCMHVCMYVAMRWMRWVWTAKAAARWRSCRRSIWRRSPRQIETTTSATR